MTRREFGLSCAAAGLSQGAATRPHFLSATDAAAAIRAKKISSLELTRAAFDQNDARNPKLNAVILQFREEALARAREADRALANKRVWGPLHGGPVTINE